MASVMICRPKRSRISAMIFKAFFAQTLECIGRGARLVGAAAEELRAGRGHLLGDRKSLLAALDGARARQ